MKSLFWVPVSWWWRSGLVLVSQCWCSASGVSVVWLLVFWCCCSGGGVFLRVCFFFFWCSRGGILVLMFCWRCFGCGVPGAVVLAVVFSWGVVVSCCCFRLDIGPIFLKGSSCVKTAVQAPRKLSLQLARVLLVIRGS